MGSDDEGGWTPETHAEFVKTSDELRLMAAGGVNSLWGMLASALAEIERLNAEVRRLQGEVSPALQKMLADGQKLRDEIFGSAGTADSGPLPPPPSRVTRTGARNVSTECEPSPAPAPCRRASPRREGLGGVQWTDL